MFTYTYKNVYIVTCIYMHDLCYVKYSLVKYVLQFSELEGERITFSQTHFPGVILRVFQRLRCILRIILGILKRCQEKLAVLLVS